MNSRVLLIENHQSLCLGLGVEGGRVYPDTLDSFPIKSIRMYLHDHLIGFRRGFHQHRLQIGELLLHDADLSGRVLELFEAVDVARLEIGDALTLFTEKALKSKRQVGKRWNRGCKPSSDDKNRRYRKYGPL